MQAPPGAPDWLDVFTAEERPDRWVLVGAKRSFAGLWPEFNYHGTHAVHYFGALYPRFAHLQALFLDRRSGGLVARARCIPFRWDGTLEDLPTGIDAAGLRALEDPSAATALSALSAEVSLAYQGAGISTVVLQVMAAMARSAGLAQLVVPLRPSWKERYPLTPIERYATWKRDDGLPFDPWMRIHARLGGRVLRCEPRSMEITGAVGDWETWTAMAFPEDGEYVFPGGLAPLNVVQGTGCYWEPNVWVQHEVA